MDHRPPSDSIFLIDVLLKKVHEAHDQNNLRFCHRVTYGWNNCENKLFPLVLGTH